MTNLIIQKLEEKNNKKNLPEIRPGYTVKVYQKIKEGDKQRIQVYEGLVIAVNHGHGASKTITVRKIVTGIGVEKIFPVNSPNIEKIEVIKIGKVRRAKLYYMRNVSGKAARLKEKMVSQQTVNEADNNSVEENLLEVNTQKAPQAELLSENTQTEAIANEENVAEAQENQSEKTE